MRGARRGGSMTVAAEALKLFAGPARTSYFLCVQSAIK